MNRAIRTAATVNDAIKAFVGLQHVGLERETEVYNCLLHRVAKEKRWEQVLQAFRQMLDAGVPTNSDTYSALLGACIKGRDLRSCTMRDTVLYLPVCSTRARNFTQNCLVQSSDLTAMLVSTRLQEHFLQSRHLPE